MRKEADLAVTDRIAVEVHADAEVVAAARLYADYIHDETLIGADASRWAETSLHVAAVTGEAAVDLNGHPVRIALSASPT